MAMVSVWVVSLLAGGRCAAQSGERASFDLELIREGHPGFDADPFIEGPPGGDHLFFANLLILQSGFEEDGVQGWSFSLWHSNLDLISITTEGTVLREKKDGGFFDLGFLKYETIDPAKFPNEGRRGVIQGAVLSNFRPVHLPNGKHIVGRHVYRAQVPEGGASAFIRFTDGLRGSGQPVQSILTVRGNSRPAPLGSREIALGARLPPERACSDGIDNDRDGWTDCKDPQCRVLLPECGGEVCGDGKDNDGDMLTDCKDSDCLPGSCYEECDDGVDNNGDSVVDCDDPSCLLVSPCRVPEECDDGIDNDGDGRIDCVDPECDFIGDCPGPEICGDNVDNDLDGRLDCNDVECIGIHPCVGPEDCEDGVDNNGDGKVDCDDSYCIRFAPGNCTGSEVCGDGIDNDRDGKTDCDDPQCFGVPPCPAGEICNDGIDNDGDGATDCLDPRCLGIPPCLGPEVCGDRLDNDGDGKTDCRDPDCLGHVNCPPIEVCGDGIDNDRDFRADCEDPDCRFYIGCPSAEACNDGVDNDDDGKIDCSDPECEADPSCSSQEGFDLLLAAEGSVVVEGRSILDVSPMADGGIPVTVNIVPYPAPQPVGVQGWSLSVVHDRNLLGFDPSGGAPTISGTDAEKLFSGGFQKTEVGRTGTGMGGGVGQDPGAGFVSAVVLSLTEAAELDPRRAQSVARASYVLERPLDPGVPVDSLIRFVDGLRGSGQPIRNLFTVSGASVEPVHLVPLAIRFSTDTRFLRGDANGDEAVDVADAIWCVNELLRRGPRAPCHRAADANGDGSYDLSDAMYLIQWLFLSGPLLPQPFPGCGTGAGSGSWRLECPQGSVAYCGE